MSSLTVLVDMKLMTLCVEAVAPRMSQRRITRPAALHGLPCQCMAARPPAA